MLISAKEYVKFVLLYKFFPVFQILDIHSLQMKFRKNIAKITAGDKI